MTIYPIYSSSDSIAQKKIYIYIRKDTSQPLINITNINTKHCIHIR